MTPYLALEKFQAGTSTGRDVAQLVLGLVVGDESSRVATTNDDSCAVGRGFDAVIEKSFGAVRERRQFEHTRRSSCTERR